MFSWMAKPNESISNVHKVTKCFAKKGDDPNDQVGRDNPYENDSLVNKDEHRAAFSLIKCAARLWDEITAASVRHGLETSIIPVP